VDDPRLASSRLHADTERLRAQALVSWPRELAALRRLGLRDAARILEVGSGPGFVTEQLLQALPSATVTAVELDPSMCAFAASHLTGYGRDRLEIVNASILQTDLPASGFDFALVRFVLQHVSAPDLALLEILRLLRPGGTVASFDIDDALGDILEPSVPAFRLVGQRMRQLQARQGGNREIGRQLWRLVSDAGFVDVNLEAVVVHSHELGLEPFLQQLQPARYQPLIALGALSVDEFEAYCQAYERFVASPNAFVLQLILIASGSKAP
jgi:ubiquinone/menaquinone biosynthesis C-methylase UbiE